jgi:hypothetical protein
MIRLTKSLGAWGTPEFRDTLKREIESLGVNQLPIQEGLAVGSYAVDHGLQAMILNVVDGPASLNVHAGLFYSGIIAGCSCADDPTPVDEHSEYCEVRLDIDKTTGETRVTLAPGTEGPGL